MDVFQVFEVNIVDEVTAAGVFRTSSLPSIAGRSVSSVLEGSFDISFIVGSNLARISSQSFSPREHASDTAVTMKSTIYLFLIVLKSVGESR